MYINAIIRNTDSIDPDHFFAAAGRTIPVPGTWLEAPRWIAARCSVDRREGDRSAWCDFGPVRRSIWRSVQVDASTAVMVVLVGYSGVRPDLVVTRFPSLVEVLRERGIIDDSTPVLERATREEIKQKHVVGLLPNYLSSLAASITELPMKLTPEDRRAMQRGDLGLERTREVTGDPVRYQVVRLLADGVDQ